MRVCVCVCVCVHCWLFSVMFRLVNEKGDIQKICFQQPVKAYVNVKRNAENWFRRIFFLLLYNLYRSELLYFNGICISLFLLYFRIPAFLLCRLNLIWNMWKMLLCLDWGKKKEVKMIFEMDSYQNSNESTTINQWRQSKMQQQLP